jgi:phosphoglycolate phosphatase-like HAD superfamily hydrolase
MPATLLFDLDGTRTVGVLWGFGSEPELRDAGADAIVEPPEELVATPAVLLRGEA